MTTNTAMPASPTCEHTYAVAMENGHIFCPECREDFDSAAPPPAPPVGRQLGEPLPREDDVIAAVDQLGSYDTVVEVTHDDGGSGNVRADRYVYHTEVPHSLQDALDMAVEHFSVAVGSHVEEARVAERIPDVDPVVVDDPNADAIAAGDDDDFDEFERQELEEIAASPPADGSAEADAILAAAYLDTLTGTGVTLEGGQRATLLDFPDDDTARVRLADGSVATVDFNDIVRADEQTPETPAPDVELDDDTAQLFGNAALIMACLVIEAGIASIEGEGADAHLIEPPSNWFPPDEDAIPLMEQASASAVAMLCQTFALPRAELRAMVARVRESVTAPDA